MRIGKLEENIVKRSVIRPLSPVMQGNAAWKTACIGPLPGYEASPRMQVTAACSRLWTQAARPSFLTLQALLPPSMEEAALKQYMKELAAAAAERELTVSGGHTQVTDSVTKPLFTVTAFGKSIPEEELRSHARPLQPGDTLLLTDHIALAGTAAAAEKYREKLDRRLPEALIDKAVSFAEQMLVPETAAFLLTGKMRKTGEAEALQDLFLYDLSQGGILGALRLVTEKAGVGLTADLKAIPIRQETVEICEQLDLNPYELYSAGSLLIGTKEPEKVRKLLTDAGISAVVFGRTTSGKDRILQNEEEIRFLDRIPQDAWYRLYDADLYEGDRGPGLN